MWSTYLNSFLGLLMVVTLIFTWGDGDKIAKTATGYPFIQVLFNVTKSLAATDVLSSILIITLTASVIACVATASRQLWAFARDRGVPFSETVAYVSRRFIRPTIIHVKLLVYSELRIFPGQPTLERPSKCRPHIPRRNQPPIPHQHRLLRRPQRHPRPRLCKSARLIHDQHRLCNGKALAWRTPSPSTMESW